MMLESTPETTRRAVIKTVLALHYFFSEKLLVVIFSCCPKNKKHEARLQDCVTTFTLLETESVYLVLMVYGGEHLFHFEAFRVSGNINSC